MKTLVGVSVFALATGFFGSDPAARTLSNLPSATASAAAASRSNDSGDLCEEGTFSDDGVCTNLPRTDENDELSAVQNLHREKSGRWASYEQIPRSPERPEDYDKYRYPIPPGIPGGHFVVSGYDLDRPDDRQRRGMTLKHTGHGAVDLPQRRGEPVRNVPLEHQNGETEVLYVGPLFGNTVVTKHVLREAGELRDYVVLFGHLERPEAGLAPGMVLRDGDLLGYVGDTGSPSLVHLHLEVRRVREGVTTKQLTPDRLFDLTVVCDPRNVLPLRE